jgi:hypothetical protein
LHDDLPGQVDAGIERLTGDQAGDLFAALEHKLSDHVENFVFRRITPILTAQQSLLQELAASSVRMEAEVLELRNSYEERSKKYRFGWFSNY